MQSDDPDFEARAADVIGSISIPLTTRPCSLWMRRPRFKRSTASTPCCRYLQGVPSVTASSNYRPPA
jgi:hypothetical protein